VQEFVKLENDTVSRPESEQKREQCDNDYSCGHILTCPTCSKKYNDLDKMVKLYREINKELQQER
jgi:hypothetical protein